VNQKLDFSQMTTLYRKILNVKDMEMLQRDLDKLGDWTVENEMKINPNKCKAIRFTKARIKDPLNYFLRDQIITEDSFCKYLGIVIRSDLTFSGRSLHICRPPGRSLHLSVPRAPLTATLPIYR
jgi:hypothetical protein